MNGVSFIALSCTLFFAWANQVGANQHRHHEYRVVRSTDIPLEIPRELPDAVESPEKTQNFIQKSFPPRLATPEELKEYENIVGTTIKKANFKTGDNNLSALIVDELLNAKIKHAVLPPPFTTVVQAFDVKLFGHLPSDPKKKLTCHVSFEYVSIASEHSFVIPPVTFVCNSKEGVTASTVQSPEAVSVTGNPTDAPGSLNEIENAHKYIANVVTKTKHLPKGVKIIQDYPMDDNASTIINKMVENEPKTKYRYKY